MNKLNLIKEYEFAKIRAQECFFANKIAESLSFVQFAARIAWFYPIIYNYIDDELELLLSNVSKKILPEYVSLNSEPNKVVFYAGQLVDNGALTEQYLDYLVNLNYKVLIVVPDEKNIKLGRGQIKHFSNFSNVDLFFPNEKANTLKIKSIFNKIKEFRPSLAFLHFMPDDIVGYCVFSRLTNVKRYYIVHNDHTFWLGKNCSDYFLEFRSFGAEMSITRRGIRRQRIFKLPFYPIKKEVDFLGFPFDPKDKVIGLSGANLYKYLIDPNLEYFEWIKKLLSLNKKFVFCLCGWGDGVDKILSCFESESKRGQFYFLGKRPDFYQLISRCDIYFESYPLKSGLTVAYAAENNKAIIGIANYKNASGNVGDFLGLENIFEPDDMSSFFKSATELINSETARKINATKYRNYKSNKLDFNLILKEIMNSNYPFYETKNDNFKYFDDDYYLNEFLNLDTASRFMIETNVYLVADHLNFIEKLNIFKSILFENKIGLKQKVLLTGKLFFNKMLNKRVQVN